MNIDDSSVTQVTHYTDPDDISVPQWSADGRKILFTKYPDGGLEDVYIVNADGSGVPVNLINLDTAYDFFADQQPLNAVFYSTTAGPSKAPNYSGGTLNFSGEDVLGFCADDLGPNTTGLWHKVIDGSDQGMPKNSTDSISLSADGNVLYLTTRSAFNVSTLSPFLPFSPAPLLPFPLLPTRHCSASFLTCVAAGRPQVKKLAPHPLIPLSSYPQSILRPYRPQRRGCMLGA